MTAGSTKPISSWPQRMRSASPTERNYPNAEIVMHENEPAYWFDDEKCKGHQPGAEMHDCTALICLRRLPATVRRASIRRGPWGTAGAGDDSLPRVRAPQRVPPLSGSEPGLEIRNQAGARCRDAAWNRGLHLRVNFCKDRPEYVP